MGSRHHDKSRSHGEQSSASDGPGWMHVPCCVGNSPPGLEYLARLDQIIVDQEIQYLEVITGYETNNKFSIKNISGQKIYYAYEETDCCTRNCCGSIRAFEMKIVDNHGTEVIHLNRPFRCDCCLCFCCLQSIEVEAPPGRLIGTIKQKCRVFCPSFTVKDRRGKTVLRIEGPCWRQILCCGFCGNVDYLITLPDGKTIIGKISKQWSEWVRETFTDADVFGVSFPIDLDVRMKALLIGGCILINAMYYESNSQRDAVPGV